MNFKGLTPRQRAFLDIDRNVLIYLFTFFLTIPPAINLVGGRTDEYGALDPSGNVIWQIIDLFAFANCIFIARYSNIAPRMLFFCLLPFLGMFLWSLLSITWSEYPWLTMRRSSRMIIEVVSFVILALSISTSEEVLRILFRVFFVINLLDLISIAAPSISQTVVGFAGVHGDKNLAGEFFYLALPVFFIGSLNRSVSRFRSAALFALVSAGGMLLVSLSKTGLGTAVIATAFCVTARIAFSTRYRMPILFIYAIAAILLMLFVASMGVSDAIRYVFGDPTLTNRDLIWAYALSQFETNPLGGVGFGALWQIGPNLQAVLVNQGIWVLINEAHNGYIEILTQLGIIGLSMLIIFLLMSLSGIYRYAGSPEGHKRIGLADYAIFIFTGGLIYSITESFFFMSTGLWFLFVFVLSATRHFSAARVKSDTWTPSNVTARLRRSMYRAQAPEG
jgi:exopolysaccharide production protein ExoQ